MGHEDRFVGCLLGLAIGDALGMPVEGWSAAAIRARYGRLVSFLPAPRRGLRAGQFTDDTQMAIYLAQSIVDCGSVEPEHVAQAWVDWLHSGDVRGIGRSTYLSLRRLASGISWKESGQRGEYAAGNGAAMRVAPVGLVDCLDLERLRQDVRDVSIITHANREAVAGAQAVAYAVARLATEQARLDTLIEDVVAFIGPGEVAGNLHRAQELLAADISAEEALVELGNTGWVVHTIASSFFCFLKTAGDFEATVVAAVMGGGDTDTIAAIAGALSGAHNGVSGIPARWLEGVEDRERLSQLARQLHRLSGLD